MAESSGWRLRLLGEFVLEHDGQIVDRFGTRKEELVLAYVAIAAHTALVRNAVAAEFWPHDPPSAARKNLSYNLSILRSRFAEHGFDAPFSASRSTARLSDELRVDIEDFSALMLSASVAAPGPLRIEALEKALAMYGGGLLPSYSYRWLAPHQARFAAMYEQAVALLTTTMQPGAAQRRRVVGVGMIALRQHLRQPLTFRIRQPETVGDPHDACLVGRQDGAQAAQRIGALRQAGQARASILDPHQGPKGRKVGRLGQGMGQDRLAVHQIKNRCRVRRRQKLQQFDPHPFAGQAGQFRRKVATGLDRRERRHSGRVILNRLCGVIRA